MPKATGTFSITEEARQILLAWTVNENIPRDRFLSSIGNNPGNGLNIDGWTITRVTYTGANSAIGLDGNFGFDDSSYEPANTGSGQVFQNGNSGATIDLTASQINFAGAAGDVFEFELLTRV